jgi:predicted nucleotidyltransferase
MTLELEKLADLARANLPGVCFITVSGAHLYGFPSEDSDIDLRGCYQLPLDDLIGLRRPVETRDPKLDLAGREVELVAHEVGKYLRLLCKHNGYILEQVFSPLVVLGNDFLEQLRPLARRCITRNCYRHYRGFLQTQLQLLDKEEVKKAKTLLYAYRVVLTGIHLLRAGEVQANIVVLNREFKLPFIDELIAKKQAKEHGGLSGLDYAWHGAELARWEERLGLAFEQSTLPEEPPRDAVHEFLIGLRLPGRRGAAV